jgi:hypothetical protein
MLMEITTNARCSLPNKKYRLETGQKIINFESAVKQFGSDRKAAENTGVPRSTYQHLRDREQKFGMSETTREFFRTSDGVNFLHSFTLAIEFVISQICGGGIGAIQKVYELSQLNKIIATSTGAIGERLKVLENRIIEFGTDQFEQLSKAMASKSITCALDETFPSDICLVGIEPVSNFILAEQFADKRDSDTWKEAMQTTLDKLPVNVIQVVSDEARALLKYCRDHLGAHHSPDLFHVQQEISKATSAPMRARLKSAQSVYDDATVELLEVLGQKNEMDSLDIKPVGRPVNYDQRLDIFAQEHQDCLEELSEVTRHKQSIRDANKGIGDDYHPFDLRDGTLKTPERLRADLDARFEVIQSNADDAGLSDNSHKRIKKARKVTDSMVATLRFFWTWVATELSELNVTAACEKLFKEVLILIKYLEIQLPKSRNSHEKNAKKALLDIQRKNLENDELWKLLEPEERNKLMELARKSALIFQRSSSCVEGRNGQLALMHHSGRSLNPRKLSSLTVVHNYYIRRSDRSTAAERFFEQKHEDLFLWLLERVDCPAFPAKKGVVRRNFSQAA